MRYDRRIAMVLALTLSAPFSARGDEVDRYIETQMRNLHIPGLSLAIVRDGRVIKARGYGLADLELGAPATKSTVYEIGSNTKQFTAAAIMMLVEEGKAGLDDRITKYFPEAPKAWEPITVRHLLTHTSGIQNHVAVPGYLGAFKTNLLGENTPARDELLEMFFKLPLEFQPGQTWAYDNTGYILLGILVEKASGKSFWQFLDERIFKPLGMVATRNTDPREVVANRASGYEWVNNRFENRPILAPFVAFSSGSILSTVEDMARWDAALRAEKLLTKSSYRQMWTPARAHDGAAASFNYGFGWFIDAYHGHRLVQHSGGTPGFSSVIYRFIDDNLTVIVLTNHGDRIMDQLAIEIAGIYAPGLKRPEGTADPDPRTSGMLRQVVSELLKGRHDPDRFTAPMRIFLTTATGKGFWQWFAAHGELKSFTFSDREDADNGRILRYKVFLGENPYWFSAQVTADGKIAQIYCW